MYVKRRDATGDFDINLIPIESWVKSVLLMTSSTRSVLLAHLFGTQIRRVSNNTTCVVMTFVQINIVVIIIVCA
jgi:hypothetical protein